MIMSESLERLKYIRDGAPKEATHHYFICPDEYNISNYIDMDNCNWWDSTLCEWKSWGGVADSHIRSLSDISRIIELMEGK